MLIFLSLLVPLITVVYLAVFQRKRMVWWEYLVVFVVPLLLTVGMKSCVETCQTADTEYWGGWVTQAAYFEEWDEEVPCRHAKYRTETYIDSDGNLQTRQVFDGWQHPYDVDDHPPYWEVVDSNGITISVSQRHYRKLVAQFGNEKFVDLGRFYHSIDGDEYVSEWQGQDATLEPVTTTHTYENRVQASRSIFNFTPVDKETKQLYGLYDYPKITGYYDCASILGVGGFHHTEADKLLSFWNAKLGSRKQVRMYILLFTDQPREAGLEQENLWKGGNKNEFIVAIGINKAWKVQWAHVISWTEVEELKVDTRKFVESQPGQLDLLPVVSWMVNAVDQNFARKHFSDFSYLTVEPPMWAVILTFILTIICSGAVAFFVVNNDEDPEPEGAGDP